MNKKMEIRWNSSKIHTFYGYIMINPNEFCVIGGSPIGQSGQDSEKNFGQVGSWAM